MDRKRRAAWEKRRAAWESAIAKRKRGEDVPEDEHYALLREGMFNGEATPTVLEEADLFLRYWCGGMDHRPFLGSVRRSLTIGFGSVTSGESNGDRAALMRYCRSTSTQRVTSTAGRHSA